MKKSSAFLILTGCIVTIACNNGQQINGNSLKTVNRSITYIKERLPFDQRIEYEVAFWTLRDEIKNNKEFLEAVDGKTPEQLIETGKELFNKRKTAGSKEYEKFSSWDQMIAQYAQERIDQNRKKPPEEHNKKNSQVVTYKMRGM